MAGSTIVAHNNSFTGNRTGVLKLGTTVVDPPATGGTTFPVRPLSRIRVARGQSITGTGATSVNYAPWLVYSPDSDPAVAGVQLPTTVTITAGNDVSAAENDFTLLQNAVAAVADGQTLNLRGDFDWTAPFAAAAYKASSAGSATGDIRGVELPAASIT